MEQLTPPSHSKPVWTARKGSRMSLARSGKRDKEKDSLHKCEWGIWNIKNSSPPPLPIRKRQIPLEIQHFAAKKEAKAGYERGAWRYWIAHPAIAKPFQIPSRLPRHWLLPAHGQRLLWKGQSSGSEQPSVLGPGSSWAGERDVAASHWERAALALPGLVLDWELLKQGWSWHQIWASSHIPGKQRWRAALVTSGMIYRSWAHPSCKPGDWIISKIRAELKKWAHRGLKAKDRKGNAGTPECLLQRASQYTFHSQSTAELGIN